MSNIVITGSTRGIGLGLAREFARRGNGVVVSGRSAEASSSAARAISAGVTGRIHGIACDTRSLEQVEHLWQESVVVLGSVDIWINNAGQAHETHRFWEQPASLINDVISTNLGGLMHGTHVALRGMIPQGRGAIYNLTGFGRTNLFQPGMAIYGTSKRGVDYFSKAIAREARDTGVIVGQINPGMVVTDMLRQGYSTSVRDPASIRRVYNLLADTPEEIAPGLVDRILANRSTGVLINRQPRYRVIGRLVAGLIRGPRRDVLSGS